MMNKLVLENGLTFRVDKTCQVTRRSMTRLFKDRYRHAMYAFRVLFSQQTLEECGCASGISMNKKDVLLAQEMNYLNEW